MDTQLKAELITFMQQYLDDFCDELGSEHGIWQDTTSKKRNAVLMANAAESVIDAMELQRVLNEELG